MKKLLPLLLAMLAMQSIAQDNYSGFNYQAVVRNANGEPMPNQSVSVRFILGCGIALPYTETHSATSDARGLINLVIGEGTPDPIGIPSFDAIDWNGCGAAPWVLQVSMDITGGTNYVSLGSQQLKAVPFALNAVSADTLTSGVHWELVGNELRNTNAGVVAVQGDETVNGDVYVEGGVFLNDALNFPDWDISGQTGSLTFNELFQGPRLTLAPGGNVGIGTPLPAAKLDVSGEAIFRDPNNDATAYVDMISGTTGHLTTGVVGGSGGATILWNRKNTDLTLGTNDLPRLTVKGNGNIGIGVQDPGSSKLHVAAATNGLTVTSNSTAAGDTPFLVRSGNGSIEGLIVRANGNVGMGTINPQSKLAVNGKITCKEVEVTLSGFPDYVFEPDYELMTLEEVESYIKANGHLPNVPSACEVEENGLGLGEMNKILLEKVEELTLHLIEKDQQMVQVLERLRMMETRLNGTNN